MFIIAFLPRSNYLLISWLQSPCTVILEPKKRKSVTASIFAPYICHEALGLDIMILVFLIFSLIQLFHSLPSPSSRDSLVPLHFLPLASSSYLRLLMFLLPVLIPAYNSSSPAFLMKCSVYRLNKQSDSRQPCGTPFSILNQLIFPYSVLTIAS